MNKDEIIRKVVSRKFLLSVAAFLTAFFSGVTGILPPEQCAIGMALSAGIYAFCEAYVDGQREKSSQTVSTTSVTATSASQKVVEKAFGKEAHDEN